MERGNSAGLGWQDGLEEGWGASRGLDEAGKLERGAHGRGLGEEEERRMGQ